MHQEMSLRSIGLTAESPRAPKVSLRQFFVVVALALCSFAVGCKQGVGERCQINSDCEEGLICARMGTGGTELFCQEPGTVPTVDASPVVDSGPPADAGVTPDAAADANVTDAAPDAAVNDAQVTDAP